MTKAVVGELCLISVFTQFKIQTQLSGSIFYYSYNLKITKCIFSQENILRFHTHNSFYLGVKDIYCLSSNNKSFHRIFSEAE